MRRILLLCNKVPFPPRDGSTIAMASNIRGLLANGSELTILALNTKKHHVHQLPKDIADHPKIDWHLVNVNTTPTALGALWNLIFSSSSYMVSRFDQSASRARLTEILQKQSFDKAIVDGVFMMPYADMIASKSIPIYLRSHNVEHKIWERFVASESSALKRSYFNIQANRLKRFELAQLNLIHGIMPITEVDSDWFNSQKKDLPTFTYPCGITPSKYPELLSKSPDVFHIGAMDWMPNVDGIRWFLKKVWPEVLKMDGQALFHLAGRDTDKLELHDPQFGIFVEGKVPSSQKFYEQHGIFVVPLRSGSGMRIKVLEAMAYGKAIVSTSIGVEGIPFTHGTDGLIADTPQEFAKAVCRLIRDTDYRLQLGQNARKRALEQFNEQELASQLLNFMYP